MFIMYCASTVKFIDSSTSSSLNIMPKFLHAPCRCLQSEITPVSLGSLYNQGIRVL